jgi:flagellar M-ring protein FliF
MSTFWQEVLTRPREIYARLSKGQRVGVMALVAVGVVVALLASLLAGRDVYALLYRGLEPQDAREVCSKLQELGVPYQLSPDESAVQVPEQRVTEARMQLASANLPKLGSPGFELFDQNQLGMTDTLFNVTSQRAIAGTLQKTIEKCGPVKSATVVVQLQSPTFLQKESSRTSASVTLWTRAGMKLTEENVAAIVHMVLTAVGHGIQSQDVTVMDNDFHLLHPRGDADDPLGSLAHLNQTRTIEQYLQQKAESQLATAFGPEKASVRVSVEVDRTHKETAAERLSEDNKVPVRDRTTTERTPSGGSTTGGDPSLSANAATAKTKEGGAAPVETHSETEKEYREGVTRELTILGGGAITHMSVSLALDDSLFTKLGADGKPAPLDPAASDAMKANLEKLVKSAVGFSDKPRVDKGAKDDFSSVVLSFPKPPPPVAPPGLFSMENLLPLAGRLAESVTVLVVLLLLVKTLRGGALGRGKTKVVTAGGVTTVVGPTGDRPTEDETLDLEMGDTKGPDLRTRLGRFVNKHPDQAREVLTAWLKEELVS